MPNPYDVPEWAWAEAAALRSAVIWQSNASNEIIARALLAAERRGIERAAKVAEGEVYHHRYRTWPFWPENSDGGRGNLSEESEIVLHADKIAAAIRQLGEMDRSGPCL